MIMTKLRFIDSSRNERERDENTVETTVTEMIVRDQHRASHMNVIKLIDKC